jgi:PAS domain S-box-containing protein
MQIHMREDDFIVSKTDTKGKITYGNEIFIKMSGYEETELLNAPHNILRHQDMPAIVFALLWERIQKGEFINAYVKNKCKNGDFYWVFANVTPSYNTSNQIIGHYSVRRKPSDKAIQIIEPLYKQLLKIEKEQGKEASRKLLEQTLKETG